MAKSQRTPRECFQAVENHVARLVASTLTKQHPVFATWERGATRCLVGSRDQRGPVGIPVRTSRGRIYLFTWQIVEAEGTAPRKYRPVVCEYAYRLQEGPDLKDDRALIRWEYAPGNSVNSSHPRHHVQLATTLESGAIGVLDLNRLHIPSGWTTLESIIRFLVTDLGVRPLGGIRDCLRTLDESENRFFEEFVPHR